VNLGKIHCSLFCDKLFIYIAYQRIEFEENRTIIVLIKAVLFSCKHFSIGHLSKGSMVYLIIEKIAILNIQFLK